MKIQRDGDHGERLAALLNRLPDGRDQDVARRIAKLHHGYEFGTEAFALDSADEGGLWVEYVNVGDTYRDTFVRTFYGVAAKATGDWKVSTWGDVVEAYENERSKDGTESRCGYCGEWGGPGGPGVGDSDSCYMYHADGYMAR